MKQLDIQVAGYERQKTTAFCLSLTYKTKNPANVLPVGASSAGKSMVMDSVLNFFPLANNDDMIILSNQLSECEKDHEIVTVYRNFWEKHDGMVLHNISAKALTRFQANDPMFTWDHKIIGLAELDGASTAAPILRMMASEGGGATLVTEKSENGRFYTNLYTSKGRPLIFATTASDEIEHQFANRCFMIEMKPADLKKVHLKIAEKYAGKLGTPNYGIVKQEIQSIPEINDVLIPFSGTIATSWYYHTVVSNRTLQDLFRLIHGVAILHYQNRDIKNGYLIAKPEDYDLARQIFCGLKLKLSAPLLKTFHSLQDLEKTVSVLRPVVASDGLRRNIKAFTIDEVADLALKSGKQVYLDLMRLMDQGLVKRTKWDEEYVTKKQYIYYLTKFAKSGDVLPTWKALTGFDTQSYKVNGVGE